MNTYTIRPLRVGIVRRIKKSNRTGLEQLSEAPLISYYLEGGGHKILVDTGGTPPDGVRWQPYFRSEDECLDRALLNIGVLPEDIDIVLLTHLHWDHCANNHLFSKARFITQKKEYDYLITPEPEVIAGYDAYLALQTNYELIDGDCDIVDGISVVLAPGHTKGMQCVVVDTAAGKYIISGDLFLSFEDWEVVPRIPTTAYYDLNVIKSSFDKIERIKGIVLPGHDNKVFEQAVYP